VKGIEHHGARFVRTDGRGALDGRGATPVRYWALVPGATLLQALPTGDVGLFGMRFQILIRVSM